MTSNLAASRGDEIWSYDVLPLSEKRPWSAWCLHSSMKQQPINNDLQYNGHGPVSLGNVDRNMHFRCGLFMICYAYDAKSGNKHFSAWNITLWNINYQWNIGRAGNYTLPNGTLNQPHHIYDIIQLIDGALSSLISIWTIQWLHLLHKMTSSNGNIFRVTGPLWGE